MYLVRKGLAHADIGDGDLLICLDGVHDPEICLAFAESHHRIRHARVIDHGERAVQERAGLPGVGIIPVE